MESKIQMFFLFVFANQVWGNMYQDYQEEKFNFKLEEKRQLSNYSSLIRSAILGPVSGYEIDDDPITRAGFRFQVSRLQGFDEVAGEMKLISSVFIFWSDFRLSWNPYSISVYQEKTGSSFTIAFLEIMLKEIWKPHISLFNPVNAMDIFKEREYEKAIVHEEGFVYYDGLLKTETFCQPNLKNFPFDEHDCSVQFIATSTVITNIMNKKPKLFDDNAKWIYYQQDPCDLDLAPSRYGAQQNKERRIIVFPIKIIRRPSFLFVNIAVPLLVLSVLNTVVYFIPTVPQDRLSFSIALLLSFTVYLIYVAELIPETSNPVPLIIYFLVFQFLLSAFITCTSFVTALLNQKIGEISIPQTISRILRGFRKKCVRGVKQDAKDTKMKTIEEQDLKNELSEESIPEGNSASGNIAWRSISLFFDKVCLTIIVLVLVLEIIPFVYLASQLTAVVEPVSESNICQENPVNGISSFLCVDNVTECIALDLIR